MDAMKAPQLSELPHASSEETGGEETESEDAGESVHLVVVGNQYYMNLPSRFEGSDPVKMLCLTLTLTNFSDEVLEQCGVARTKTFEISGLVPPQAYTPTWGSFCVQQWIQQSPFPPRGLILLAGVIDASLSSFLTSFEIEVLGLAKDIFPC